MVTTKLSDELNRKPNLKQAVLINKYLTSNNIFNVDYNEDGLKDKWIALRDYLLKNGIELVTWDLLKSDNPLFTLSMDVQDQALEFSCPSYVILCESPQIHPKNDFNSDFYRFSKVFSWTDSSSVQNDFVKYNLGHRFLLPEADGFKSRSIFCSMIAANKGLSMHSCLDLYLERQLTIRWFEQNAPQDFELYGGDWDLPACKPGLMGRVRQRLFKEFYPRGRLNCFPSWRGKINAKSDVLLKSRFSITYENVKDLPGYITEKIFDAFSYGSVPVYWGANNITSYIPESCFIDRRNFKNNEEMYSYLKSVREPEYIDYQMAIRNYHASNAAQLFSPDKFAETIAKTILSDLKLL